ncbi:hypothetical protein EJ08DRAFT_566939, partial [Tothia fuscella]
NAIPRPPPCQSILPETPSPPRDHPDSVTASLLGVGNIQLPTPPIERASTVNFRLPSFNLLGIAAPHPDQISTNPGSSALPLGFGPPSQPSDPLHMSRHHSRFFSTSSPNIGESLPGNPYHTPEIHKAVPRYVLTHTPPDDAGTINWGSSEPNQAASSMDSSGTPTPTADDDTPQGDKGPFSPLQGLGINSSSSGLASALGAAPWLCEALPVIQGGSTGHLKVLSHALPSPSSAGHAFPVVIDAIEQSTSPDSIVWINVWHAVSGRFSLEDLPKSPPTTPAPPHGGDDYFTTKIFNMAVEVPDYSQKTAQPLLQMPQPAISPASIDVSIVERYIPPGSTIEFAELFCPTGRSFLSDRLVELSPQQGTLLFVYPTKTGGETFKKEYIGPILDPLLREMGTAHDLSTNILVDIGAMVATEKLISFEEMLSQLQEFCRALGSGEAGTSHSRYHRQGTDYSIIHSSKQEVMLARDVWANDWWNKQEKAKIQRAFQEHHIERAGLSTKTGPIGSKASSHQLILELLQRVGTRPYKGAGPTKGVEVGVFVIRKT